MKNLMLFIIGEGTQQLNEIKEFIDYLAEHIKSNSGHINKNSLVKKSYMNFNI